MKRFTIALSLLALMSACGQPGNFGSQSAEFRTYAASLRTAALDCGISESELPVAKTIGHYDWFPQSAPFVVNGQRNQQVITAAEHCMWERTKHLVN
jgi:hypothetical protein